MSFSVHHETAAPLEMSMAILVYGSRTSQACYATVHGVTRGPGQTLGIQPGKPLDSNVLKDVIKGLSLAPKNRPGLLPPTLLAMEGEMVMWWLPPGERTFFFKTNETGKKVIGDRVGKARHPGLVFVAGRKTLWVYAVKGAARPVAGTPLFHAPMMNVWNTGQVCTGSMPLPNGSHAEAIDQWEASFFGSAFTHPNHPNSVKYRGGIHAFWRDMLDGKHEAFPEAALVPFGTTVGGLAANLEGMR